MVDSGVTALLGEPFGQTLGRQMFQAGGWDLLTCRRLVGSSENLAALKETLWIAIVFPFKNQVSSPTGGASFNASCRCIFPGRVLVLPKRERWSHGLQTSKLCGSQSTPLSRQIDDELHSWRRWPAPQGPKRCLENEIEGLLFHLFSCLRFANRKTGTSKHCTGKASHLKLLVYKTSTKITE